MTMTAISLCVGMWVAYAIGIQYQRGGVWRILLPITLVAAIGSTVLNHTLAALLLWDWPRPGEVTFSQRLNRLVINTDWRGHVARWTAKYLLDWVAPGGKHIYPNSAP